MKRISLALTILGTLIAANPSFGANAQPRLQPLVVSGWTNAAISSVNDVALVGTIAYVADGAAGLQIIDMSNPANPVRLGSYPTTNAHRVAVSGTVAYMTDYTNGLQIIDVSTPANPVRLGGYPTGSWGAVAVSGTIAYVAASGDGFLQIIDVSNPASPVRRGSYPTGGSVGAQAVSVAGNYAYVTAWNSGLYIIDVSDPANPVRSGGLQGSGIGNARGLAVSGTVAYVASDPFGLVFIDVSNPTNPVPSGSYSTKAAQDVAVSGTVAYVADYWSGLHIIDVSDPANPARLGSYNVRVAYGVTIGGNRILLERGEKGLMVVCTVPNVQCMMRVEDGTMGTPFTIEAATNLSGLVQWTPIFTTNPTTLPFEYVDFDLRIATYPQKFYRVRQP